MLVSHKLILNEISKSISIITLVFLCLFFLFDFIDDSRWIGSASLIDQGKKYGFIESFYYVFMLMPIRLYELLPITVLIGSIFAFSRLAQNSEFTILITSGLSPFQSLRLVVLAGIIAAIFTFILGDYGVPFAEDKSQTLKTNYRLGSDFGKTGNWLKDKKATSNYFINFREATSSSKISNVKIYEYDISGNFISLIIADEVNIFNERWHLTSGKHLQYQNDTLIEDSIKKNYFDSMDWPSKISSEMIASSILRPDRMKAIDLLFYIRHLKDNSQDSKNFEIEFWKKVFFPIGIIVMLVLSLPFAYLGIRSSGNSGYIFFGVLIGISFFFVNSIFISIGNLREWEPWMAAASPGLLYSVVSLGAFRWLVLKR